MISLYDQVPKYLLGKYQLIGTVTFTSLFSLVFLLISVPFSHNAWFQLPSGQDFAYTVTFLLMSLLVIIISKMMLYRRRNTNLAYYQYILWNLAEIVVISALYTFFTFEGANFGVIDLAESSVDRIFYSAIVYTFVSLGIPYLVAAMYFALEDKDNTIRMMNFSDVVTDLSLLPHEEQRITLFDNNGALKFSIGLESLYFIESDDNYVKVWYMDSTGSMRQYMLRCRLKTIEESFSGSDLMRCHRKYMVNMNKAKVLRGERDGYVIDLDIDSVDPIPVSKTYEQAVLARFNSR